MKNCYLINLIILLFSANAIAQVVPKPNPSYDCNYLMDLYIKGMGKYNGLYNGTRYVVFPYLLTGHVFWGTPGASSGDIVYDGLQYKNVGLLYELIGDVVVINIDTEYVQLHSDMIDRFSILGHQFINISKDSASTLGLSPGFYDLLYVGKNVKILAKYTKNIQEEEIMNEKQHVVHSKDKYFMKTNKKYESVDNERMLLNLLKDRDKDISQFIRKNKINFKSDKKAALTMISTYYEQLIN